jgi:hypothetical protein
MNSCHIKLTHLQAMSAPYNTFIYHSCLDSVTIHINPFLEILAATPQLFDAFAFQNLADVDDFTGEYF